HARETPATPCAPACHRHPGRGRGSLGRGAPILGEPLKVLDEASSDVGVWYETQLLAQFTDVGLAVEHFARAGRCVVDRRPNAASLLHQLREEVDRYTLAATDIVDSASLGLRRREQVGSRHVFGVDEVARLLTVP